MKDHLKWLFTILYKSRELIAKFFIYFCVHMFYSLMFRAIASRKTNKSIFTKTLLQRKTFEHLLVLYFTGSSLPLSKYIL